MKKWQKNIIDFLKDILVVAVLIGVVYGGYQVFKSYKVEEATIDESYKVITARNSKYNGMYSLTKLDKNGKNTWDGLVIYVKNDKVIHCDKYTYTSGEQVVKDLVNKTGDKSITKNNIFDFTWTYRNELIELGYSGGNLHSNSNGDVGYTKTLATFEEDDKIDFNKVTDIKTTYDYMKECDIVPGYDEKSQEVWLSKLLNNEQSIYSNGYKLIHYTSPDEMDSKCKVIDSSAYDAEWFI